MSFDVHLMKFKNGEPSPYNAAAARAVIDSTQHTEADQFGCMSVTLSDGLEFELFLGQDESERGSFMFALRGFSETLVDFMYRLGCTDTFILIAPSEEECVILFEGAESSDLFAAHDDRVVEHAFG